MTFAELRDANKVGRVIVAITMMEKLEPNSMFFYLGGGFVTRADYDYQSKGFEFVVFSEQFRPIDEGAFIPEYEVTVNQEAGTISFREKAQPQHSQTGSCPKCKSPYLTITIKTNNGLRPALICGCIEEFPTTVEG